jgi:hypothetical protein
MPIIFSKVKKQVKSGYYFNGSYRVNLIIYFSQGFDKCKSATYICLDGFEK